MRTFLAGVATALLAVSAAHADDNDKKVFGTTSGGAIGAIGGAAVGGPVGAVVGGVAGAIIGNATAVPEPARVYVAEHPIESIAVKGRLAEDYAIPDSVQIAAIPDYPDLGYIYVENRPVIVRLKNRHVVYAAQADTSATASVSVEVPTKVVTYVRKHRIDPIAVETPFAIGTVVPDDIALAEIPDDPDLAYAYVGDAPVIVERQSRRVVWVH
ncbi:MAG: DUF1236 domain-containing protein [Mesorhizobium sp.]